MNPSVCNNIGFFNNYLQYIHKIKCLFIFCLFIFLVRSVDVKVDILILSFGEIKEANMVCGFI